MFTSAEAWGSSYLCSTGWSVCAYLWQLIAHTVYFTWHRKGDGADIVCPRRDLAATVRVIHLWLTYLKVVCVRSQQGVGCISSPGRIGVNEHCNLLARCQGLLSVITSPLPQGGIWSAVVGSRAFCSSDAWFGSQKIRSEPSLRPAALCRNMSAHKNSLI